MKKNVLFFLVLFCSSEIFACDCDPVNATLEFYESEYVFKGVAEKIYAQDSLTYTVDFKVYKHYKQNSKNPKKLTFKLSNMRSSEMMITSCDWSVNEGQAWLIFAKKNSSGDLKFSGMCSNSRILDKRSLSEGEEEMLVKTNDFKLDNYIIFKERGFTYTRPKTNIDSIIKEAKIRDYEKSYVGLNLYIDSKGNLIDVISRKNLHRVLDFTCRLTKEVTNANEKPLSLFEKDAIALMLKVKKWEIKKHKKTDVAVSYVRHIILTYDKEKKKWSYEL